jgi:hypothetical protein
MRAGEMAAHFQLLMQVETMDVDDEVVSVDCAAQRILPATPPAARAPRLRSRRRCAGAA